MTKKIVKKSINITYDLEKRIEKIISTYPGLNFTLVVNQALEAWLKGSQSIDLLLKPCDEKRIIDDQSTSFGPQAIK